jgi:hypothetical protein
MPVVHLGIGTEEAKAAILSSWIADKGQPVIVATSALGLDVRLIKIWL